jgi:hypothetical protein
MPLRKDGLQLVLEQRLGRGDSRGAQDRHIDGTGVEPFPYLRI